MEASEGHSGPPATPPTPAPCSWPLPVSSEPPLCDVLYKVPLIHTLDTASAPRTLSLRTEWERTGLKAWTAWKTEKRMAAPATDGESRNARRGEQRTSAPHPRAPGFLAEKISKCPRERPPRRDCGLLGLLALVTVVGPSAATARPQGDGEICEFLGAAPKPWHRQWGHQG